VSLPLRGPGEKRHSDELINVRARFFAAVGRGAVRPLSLRTSLFELTERSGTWLSHHRCVLARRDELLHTAPPITAAAARAASTFQGEDAAPTTTPTSSAVMHAS